jgi:hypothetical protein
VALEQCSGIQAALWQWEGSIWIFQQINLIR